MRWKQTLVGWFMCLLLAIGLASCLPRAAGQEQDSTVRIGTAKTTTKKTEDLPPNWKFGTLGGKQFWTDELIHGGWRIQRNVLSGHFRLLDADNQRRAWGSWEGCHEQWRDLAQE